MLTRKEELTDDAEVIEDISYFIMRKNKVIPRIILHMERRGNKIKTKSEESVVHWQVFIEKNVA